MNKFINGIGKYYKVFIIIVDILIINIAYILAYLIKFNGQLPEFNTTPYLNALPFITIAAVIYFDLFGLLAFYNKTIYDVIKTVIKTIFILAITTISITYFLQGYSFPRSILVMAPILQVILLSLWMTFLLKVKQHFINTRYAMIINSTHEKDSLVEKVERSMSKEKSVIKYVFDITETKQIMKKLKDVEEVFICADAPTELKKEILFKCMGGKQVIYLVPQLLEISLLNSQLMQFEDIPAFVIDRLDLLDEQKILKKLFDMLFSLIALIPSLPFMLFAAISIKLTSPGPVIYAQERVTAGNKTFKLYKFRTMHNNAEANTGPILSEANDTRITSIGKILRKYRLDELPQLFNVLKGDMSIVGPRPERPYFVKQFSADIPEYMQRYVVKAGITGIAQVLGNYDTSPEDKLRYDLLYIKSYSLLLDIKIILQTVKVIFAGNGVSKSKLNKYVQGNSYSIGK